jgi:hypothetical protein
MQRHLSQPTLPSSGRHKWEQEHCNEPGKHVELRHAVRKNLTRRRRSDTNLHRQRKCPLWVERASLGPCGCQLGLSQTRPNTGERPLVQVARCALVRAANSLHGGLGRTEQPRRPVRPPPLELDGGERLEALGNAGQMTEGLDDPRYLCEQRDCLL